MPWTVADVESHKKDLSDEQKKAWVKIANEALADCIEEGTDEDECEGRAIRIANDAVEEVGRATTYTCECLDCGHTMESEEHCVDLKCPECGGEMRRKERPGEGRAMVAFRELWEAVKRLFESLLQEQAAGKERPEERRGLSLMAVFEGVMNSMEEGAWFHDFYQDGDGLFAIVSGKGKLFRVPVAERDGVVVLGDWVPLDATPATARTSVIRQADGRVRWLSISATSVLNKVGEIDSRALFDSFITRATETGEYPYRCFYHQGEALRTGLADFLARDGDVFITSGLYDDTPLALAEIAALERDAEAWEESIHYEPTNWPDMEEMVPGVVVPVFNQGRMIEISTLPAGRAAAWFTAINVREVNRMREEVYTALVTLLDGDEEQAKGFAALVDGTNRQVKDENLVTREAGEAEPDPVLDRESLRGLLGLDERVKALEGAASAENVTEREFVLDEPALDAIVDRFNDLLAPLAARLDSLETVAEAEVVAQAAAMDEAARGLLELDARLEVLERDDDKKVAVIMADMPRSVQNRVTYRARTATQQEREAEGPQSMADIAAATLANAPRMQ